MTRRSPQDTVEAALGLSRADGCVVIAEETSTANLRWAGNTLTTNGVAVSRRLTVLATHAGAQGMSLGMASRAGVPDAELEDLVRAAERAAEDAVPAEDAMPLVSPGRAGSSDDWDAVPAQTSIGVFERLAPQLGAAFDRAASRTERLYGFARHDLTTTYLGTSTGIRLRHAQPSGKVEINAKSADLARSAWAGVGTRDFTGVDVAALDADLARRLEWARRRVELPAGRYETLLPPGAMADLMFYLYASAGARDAAEGRTVFSRSGGGTRVGDRLARLPVSLRSDPDAAGMACDPFVIAHTGGRDASAFDNGLALTPTDWIRDGRLTGLVTTRHSAGLTGLADTPWIDNLIMEGPAGSTASLDDMIARTDRGLLLTCLWYVREVEPQSLLLTGLTRDGVYLVENGEVTGAVNNFRWNDSPVGLLDRLTEVGTTGPTLARESSEYFTRTAMPPARVAGFNMSSVSQAS